MGTELPQGRDQDQGKCEKGKVKPKLKDKLKDKQEEEEEKEKRRGGE